jgi:putative two-component system response regulator
MGLLERLAITAELRDDATGRHCYRVGRLSGLIAERAGMDRTQSNDVERAARLHDIGKFAIPDAILLKPGPLDDAEIRLMRTHTTIGSNLLAGRAKSLEVGKLIAGLHHEHWNGAGYPSNLAGEAIPMSARICALADVYDALTHVRPYKRAWAHEEAIRFIRTARGLQFDPALTDLFLELMEEFSRDMPRFIAEQEAAAKDSPYVLAESRVTVALE